MDFQNLIAEHPQLFLPEYYTSITRKKYIYRQGDGLIYLYFLMKGMTKICTISEEGNEDLLSFFVAPEIVGIQNIFKEHPSERAQISIVAASPCQYYKIPYAELSAYAYGHPEIFELLLNALGRQSRSFRRHSEGLRMGQTSNVYCRILLDIAEETESGLVINRYFSNTDLANYLKVNISTISRINKFLKAKKIFSIEGSQITILDVERFRRYANGEKMTY